MQLHVDLHKWKTRTHKYIHTASEFTLLRRVSAFTYRPCKRGRLQEVPQTQMFQQLANTVGDGRCHVSESRNWADAAAQEGARAPATIAWASVGQGAKQNAERDL